MSEIQGGLKSVDGKPIPLREVAVSGDVIGGTARIRVRQRYENVEKEKIEAIYVFPLPTEASISGLKMECDGRTIEGVVKEREEAFKAYDDATLDGHGAALLEQERANVFTATVGNLLPGETTIVEIEYVQRLHAHEGALRVMIPTLVAPRYIPGAASGDRTAHGAAEPTDRVPDADRISPKIGKTDYTFGLDLALHVGEKAEISSPSHAIEIKRSGDVARVAIRNVPLDRDVVILAEGTADAPVQAVVTHRSGETGTFVFSRLIDLFDPKAKVDPLDVVFVLDRSGSMGGTSIEEARKALRLCLRQLREGDRFSIIAFDDREEIFKKVPYTQKTLEQADKWIAAIDARGGTELLAPLTHACEDATDGVVVLLTDGQVGNEDEILAAVMEKRKSTRVYAFGIGTNVSDALLSQLARRTGGALEMIHPGERIDDKVVATFSRAIATRVRDVKVRLVNIEGDELAPMTLPDLVDGEPWSLFGRYSKPGRGRIEIRGTLRGEAYLLEVPIELAESNDNASVEKLWASERVRDLETMEVEGRRQKTMKDRIVAIATRFGIASRYTSFIAIEKRTGDRRVPGQAEARAVPVNAPAGWAMFQQPQFQAYAQQSFGTRAGGMPTGAPMPAPGFAPPPPMSAAAPAPARMMAPAPAAKGSGGMFKRAMNAIGGMFETGQLDEGAASESERVVEDEDAGDPIFEILKTQLANGLFGTGDDNALAETTTKTLQQLLDHNVDAAHALHGELVKKAIVALLALIPKVKRDIAERALAVAYRAAAGKRTRKLVIDAAQQAKISLQLAASG
jgi:Ca-activated chloride channel homolog